jgi:hypothetical protein
MENSNDSLIPELDKYGWKDENSYININNYDIHAKLRRYFLQ